MKRMRFYIHSSGTLLVVASAGLFMVSAALADITSSGDVDPDDPSSWTTGTTANIGQNSTAPGPNPTPPILPSTAHTPASPSAR